jgi:Uncharacterized protein, homolog of Cu resistance protein CopC
MYTIDSTSGAEKIHEYSLSTGFDLTSTVSHIRSLDVSDYVTKPESLLFNPDGTTLFTIGREPHEVNEFVLTTGFDLSTASHVDVHVIGGGAKDHPKSIAFSDDGNKMFIAVNQRYVFEWTLPKPYNLAAPTVTFSPADDATNVALDANIVLTFSEAMDVESGDITIKKTSGDTTIETIDVTSGQVTGTGTTTITINPSSDLEQNTEYYVLIDATAFDDGSDASYAGITSTTALSFTTANSAPTLVSSVPADDATDVAINANIILNFSESVNADDGDIVIYKTSGGTEVKLCSQLNGNPL